MNYYRNFTTGTIDGLLARLGIEGYVLKSDDPKFETYPKEEMIYSRYLKEKVGRDNILEKHTFNDGYQGDRTRSTGNKTRCETKYLYEFLCKQELRAIDKDDTNWDWNLEFGSPFDNGTNIMLCFFKLITGMQSITRKPAVITRELLQTLELDVASVYEWKKQFDKLFYNSIVHSYYEDGEWHIKMGGGCLKVGEGPGYVNLKIQKENLINKIEEYHNELLEEYSII